MSETRPVLGPAGNKERRSSSINARKLSPKDEKKSSSSPPATQSLKAGPALKRREFLLRSNLSLDASCSSDASTDSFCSRASTGRIGRRPANGGLARGGDLAPRRRKSFSEIGKGLVAAKSEKVLEGTGGEITGGKRRCAWVTPNTDPCYVTFHDEEWGVPVHDDKKLFELLVLSGALAELTWPTILSKRHIFREVFMEFDLVSVSKLNEKKLLAQGSPASSLLSETKLRAIVENARETLKIIEEFGSFDRYCWSFVNFKPIASRFRYARQVPVKTPKADVISKDLIRRGFRGVGPTVIYSFMQASGMTNDHLISCYRFDECATGTGTTGASSGVDDCTARIAVSSTVVASPAIDVGLTDGNTICASDNLISCYRFDDCTAIATIDRTVVTSSADDAGEPNEIDLLSSTVDELSVS